MKTIIYVILGVILGLCTIDFVISGLHAIADLRIVSAIINFLIAYGLGLLSGKCFKNC